jgi:hypothetical protein
VIVCDIDRACRLLQGRMVLSAGPDTLRWVLAAAEHAYISVRLQHLQQAPLPLVWLLSLVPGSCACCFVKRCDMHFIV